MNTKAITAIKTKEEARQFAIKWQAYISNRSFSYGQLAEWAGYFRIIGKKYGLLREFKENCIL